MKQTCLLLLIAMNICFIAVCYASDSSDVGASVDLSLTIMDNNEVVQQTENIEGDWKYVILGDGTAEIISYRGSDTDITIPATIGGKIVTSIGENAFTWERIKRVKMPDSIETIHKSAFSWCTSLTYIELSKNLKLIEEGAFFNCINLSGITIPGSVLTIGVQAFSSCEKLSRINWSYGLQVIESRAFSSCDSLETIAIPDTVNDMGINPFANCKKLSQIYISPEQEFFAVIDGVMYSKADRRLVCYPLGITRNLFNIPEGIVSIGDASLRGCYGLKEIKMPSTLKTIGNSAFSGCVNLKSISIPEGVTDIGDAAFWGCTKLDSIDLPNSIAYIGQSAFYDCPSLSLRVNPDSYVSAYCKENNIPHTYPDSLDWLSKP